MSVRYLADTKQICDQLTSLMERCDAFSIAVAWASHENPVSQALFHHIDKLEKCVVGLHFCQTSPGFIKQAFECRQIRFVPISKVVFHPKVYVFEIDKKLHTAVGSANLTSGGMKRNDEAVCFICDPVFGKQAIESIDKWYKKSEEFDESKLNEYQKSFNKHRRKSSTPPTKFTKPPEYKQYYHLVRKSEHFGKTIQTKPGATAKPDSFRRIVLDVCREPIKYEDAWEKLTRMKLNKLLRKNSDGRNPRSAFRGCWFCRGRRRIVHA